MEFENTKEVSGLVPCSKIKKATLKPNQYTISLLNEGLRAGMLSSQEVYNIQVGLMRVLQDLILQERIEHSFDIKIIRKM